MMSGWSDRLAITQWFGVYAYNGLIGSFNKVCPITSSKNQESGSRSLPPTSNFLKIV